MKFKKAILKVGTYHSPDGKVEVTPDRLRHWEQQFGRMRNAKQIVPIDWDHGSKAGDLVPLTMEAYQKRRSAKNTVGHMVDFAVASDGQSAQVTLDVRDSIAVDKANQNMVYVSPVILQSWKDGAGNQYDDAITHVDFVNHPVDHSQGEFVPAESGALACALRMGLSKPYRMSEEEMDNEQDTKSGERNSEEGDATKSGDSVGGEDGKLKDVIAALGKMDIVLSDDTTTENFLAHLHQALLTAAAHRGEGDDEVSKSTSTGESSTTVADPGAAALSLEAKASIAWAQRQHQKEVSGRLKGLLDTGRCTPAEFKNRATSASSIKLSLDASGAPAESTLEQWIASRESIPAGTFFTQESKLRMAQVADIPTNLGEFTEEDADKAADFVFGKKS